MPMEVDTPREVRFYDYRACELLTSGTHQLQDCYPVDTSCEETISLANVLVSLHKT